MSDNPSQPSLRVVDKLQPYSQKFDKPRKACQG